MSQPHLKPDHRSPPSTPRWVKMFGIITLIVALLIIILMLMGGEHGPVRHTPSSGIDVDPTITLVATSRLQNKVEANHDYVT